MNVPNELLDRFLDGETTEDESESVQSWLEDPAHLEVFLQLAHLHADLRHSLRRRDIQTRAIATLKEAQESSLFAVDSAASSTGRGRSAFVVVTAIVCVLLVCVVVGRGLLPTASNGTVATIVTRIDALLLDGESEWNQSNLQSGEYQLQQGLLHLKFDDGVMVYVEAPARFDATSGKRVVLHNGRLSATVPPAGVGFTVATPEADVVDFGTEFSVDVESGSSEVHVFNGLVQVQPRFDQPNTAMQPVKLRSSQAVKIDESSSEPVNIALAKDRFIRNFEEPKRKYVRTMKRLNPLAYYRMPIRDRGLAAEPPKFSGIVLTGDGRRPPHAHGVFTGGSLRVKADSTGRGGRVDLAPDLTTGRFTLSLFVYAESDGHSGTIVTNFIDQSGSFQLCTNEDGVLQADIRDRKRSTVSAVGSSRVPLKTWRFVVVTADGKELRLFEDGQLVAATVCKEMLPSVSESLWLGTDVAAEKLWDGRIDELAVLDRALSPSEIEELYQSALDELARTK